MRNAASEVLAVEAAGLHKKNEDIEALRAFAVLITIIGHSGALLFWGSEFLGNVGARIGLWTGVDLFFAISGFVIARGLHDSLRQAADKEARARAVCAFWVRRAFRILPSAWLWLAISLVLTVIFNRTGAFGDLRGNLIDALAAVIHFADVHYYTCLKTHLGTCGSTALFGPYWSLSWEEKFYLVLPIAILLLGSRFRFVVTLLIAAQVLWVRETHDLLWWLRGDALLLGVLISLERGKEVHSIFEPRFVGLSRFGLAFPALLLVLLPAVATPFKVVPIYTGVVAIVAAMLVWLASYDRGYIIGTGWSRKVLAWVGARSYAMYLIHMPAFAFTHEVWQRFVGPGVALDGGYSLRFILTAAGLLLLASELNYRYIEVPLRRKGAAVSARILGPSRPPSKLHGQL